MGWGFNLLFTVSNQVIGYGMAGLCRRFLVWPASMIWPSNLVSTSVFYALHDHGVSESTQTNGWKIGRYRYFLYVLLGSFVVSCSGMLFSLFGCFGSPLNVSGILRYLDIPPRIFPLLGNADSLLLQWHWFPELMTPFLSVFAFVTWIRPNSPVINQVFGGTSGLSLIPITFDWNIVTQFVGSPLQYPVFAILNIFFAVVIFFWVITPALHFSGAFYGEFLPISDNTIRDNTGHRYSITRILTPDLQFNQTAYSEYSPVFLSTGNIWAYGMSFAAIS